MSYAKRRFLCNFAPYFQFLGTKRIRLKNKVFSTAQGLPSFSVSVAPVMLLLGALAAVLVFLGPDAISEVSPYALLAASAASVVFTALTVGLSRRGMFLGFFRSARQIMPAIPMLIFIAVVSTTWMLSGVVPTLICYGLELLTPATFLVVCCLVCALISVLTGSSWSTIATIGVAFMGIGTVMGFHPGWVAGAIISGAYFGDKVSPLSDTTVVASSACGVDLFKHIRYLMLTAIPSMGVALAAFLVAGLCTETSSSVATAEILGALHATFNISPVTLVIPALTFTLIMFRVPTLLTLFLSGMFGLAGIFVFQGDLVELLGGASPKMISHLLWSETTFQTGHAVFDDLVTTGGISGMLSTIFLITCAMIFGTAMIGTGMLTSITSAIIWRLRNRISVVSSTVAGGLFLNCCTADQYLSIIIGGNMFRNVYRRVGLEPRLLSRTLEDSVSVTSVLIPWNSCGVTQSTVLGVSTLVYFPFCIFNYLSPLMSLLMALTGFKIKQVVGRRVAAPA